MLGSGGVRRLAGRIHRGQIDRSGEPVLTSLARAAAAAGGDRTARMVAWLREADTAGVGPADAGFGSGWPRWPPARTTTCGSSRPTRWP